MNNTFFAVLRLVRLPNLFIVALTQYLLFYHVLKPVLLEHNLLPALSDAHFWVLISVTIIITGGGYIINDIVDFRVDLINNPEKVIIEKIIPIPTAYWLYFCFNLIGFVLAMYLALSIQPAGLLIIYPVAVIGLYIYSTVLKKQLVVGNLIVSLYCAGVAGIIWFAERSVLQELAQVSTESLNKINIFLFSYCLFAFLSTFFREIIKDIEDWRGDQKEGYKTIPVVFGVEKAKRLAYVPGVTLLLFIALLGFTFILNYLYPINIVIIGFLWVLVIIALLKLISAKESKDFYQLSQLTKIVMLSGLLLLLFVKI